MEDGDDAYECLRRPHIVHHKILFWKDPRGKFDRILNYIDPTLSSAILFHTATMKISPVCFRLVAVSAALGVGYVNSFTLSTTRRSTSPTALASTTIDPIFTPVKPLDRESRQTSVAATPKVAQRWRKRTKQLATLGPASSTLEMIETLFLAGADIFRLNFSHGSQEQKKDLLMMIREVEEKYSHPIAVLGDLQGPKLRVSSPM